MKVQLLPSSFDDNGSASLRQHFMSIVIDDCVAIDAGSLAFACTEFQRQNVRDIVLTHTHLDHIAGLPLFIDDLFSTLREPIRVHATASMIETLERDIFNWSIYPRFSELKNDFGSVINYHEINRSEIFEIRDLRIQCSEVNHRVEAAGYLVSDSDNSVGVTGDTAETDAIWEIFNEAENLRAVLVECAFPNELDGLASVANHLTPKRLANELQKFKKVNCPVYVINMKPMYRETIVQELKDLNIPNLSVLNPGKVYNW